MGSKRNGHLRILRRFGQLLNYRLQLQLFNAFIKPVLMYCLPMWRNCPILCQRAMDRTLTRCVHYILHDNATLLSQRVFDDTFICTFNYLVTIANAFYVYKTINSAPLDEFSSFTLLSTVSQRLSRASESKKLVLPQLCHKADNLSFYMLMQVSGAVYLMFLHH